jgi:hypothetical protein
MGRVGYWASAASAGVLAASDSKIKQEQAAKTDFMTVRTHGSGATAPRIIASNLPRSEMNRRRADQARPL